MLVKLDKFIFHVDFVVLDCDEENNILIIFGRPFMAIGKSLIDVEKSEVTMTVDKEKLTFTVFGY